MEFGCALEPWQITRLVQTFGSWISLPNTPYWRPDYQAVVVFLNFQPSALAECFEKQAVVIEMNNRLRKSLGITKSSAKTH
jgi:hypothetical protein